MSLTEMEHYYQRKRVLRKLDHTLFGSKVLLAIVIMNLYSVPDIHSVYMSGTGHKQKTIAARKSVWPSTG